MKVGFEALLFDLGGVGSGNDGQDEGPAGGPGGGRVHEMDAQSPYLLRGGARGDAPVPFRPEEVDFRALPRRERDRRQVLPVRPREIHLRSHFSPDFDSPSPME